MDNQETNTEYEIELKKLRDVIDVIDKNIVETVRHRIDTVIEVGKLKKRHGIRDMDVIRREEIKEKITTLLIGSHVPSHVLLEMYEIIFKNSMELQNLIIDETVKVN